MGPSTDPWGTPLTTGTLSDELPSTTTLELELELGKTTVAFFVEVFSLDFSFSWARLRRVLLPRQPYEYVSTPLTLAWLRVVGNQKIPTLPRRIEIKTGHRPCLCYTNSSLAINK